jgi:hypothetical protein
MQQRQIWLAGSALDGQYHTCAFFRSREEEYEVLVPFITEGLAAGEKALHITDPALRADHIGRLAEAGVDTAAAQATGQLQVLAWDEAYLRGGSFDCDAMLNLVEETLTHCYRTGFPRVRIIGHMEWSRENVPGVQELFEYEAKANDLLARHKQPGICVYDANQFDSRTMMEILRTHPIVILGGTLRQNPFYVPPDEYLRELKAYQVEGLTTRTP